MNRVLCLLAVSALFLGSCIGARTRDNALLPAARVAWPEVRVDFESGLTDAAIKGDLTSEEVGSLRAMADSLGAALESGDRTALKAVPWAIALAPWATRGISSDVAAGRLGPNSAQILYQRVANFTAVILTLQEKIANMYVYAGDGAFLRPRCANDTTAALGRS